jgi:hypothetical protein
VRKRKSALLILKIDFPFFVLLKNVINVLDMK